MNQSLPRATRRIVFLAAPGVEILDLAGPLQVFARASEMHSRANPGSPPIYAVEVATVSLSRSLIANCGLRITADRTFREVRGNIDTLLVAGGDAIEQNEINPEAVRWLKRIARRTRRVGSVCTGAMLLARAGLLDGRRATTHWNWCQTLDQTRSAHASRCRSNICQGRKRLYLRWRYGWNGSGAGVGRRRSRFATCSAGCAQSGALSAAARWPIAIQRRVITATNGSKTVARIGGLGAR